MDPFLYVAVSIIVAFVLVVAFFLKRVSSEGGAGAANVEDGGIRAPAARGEPVMVGGVRRRAGGGHRAGRMARRQDDSDEEPGEEFEHVALPDGKIGAKKMKKLQEKEEKKRMREAELREREERKEREKLREEQRKKEEAMEAALEKQREEEERLQKEEEERREHEEYLRLKEQFSVEDKGEEALTTEESASLLQEFVDYIIEMKVIMLEDLAAHFKLKTADAIARIQDLQAEGRLSGVLDDRGKFIHITPEEYEAVARFIRQRGRVSLSELAASSNVLINMAPDNAATHKKLVGEVGSS